MDTGLRHRTRRPLLIIFLCMVLACPALAASPDDAQIQWNGYTLEIISICANPEYIQNDAPETSDYYMFCLKSAADPLPVRDVVEVMNLFALTDPDTEESYPAGAYMPYNIVYNARSRVFTTGLEQSQFDLFFVVPAGTALETLSLSTSESEMPLADLDLAALVE